ncbi:hypothetical protein DCAR_0209403 [Daucus carota subsp. sativus]|uniref:Uncharacterized protein n=1 Tax=Daucus carota subsp. sativus TaxID=79200 RepID=A0AAF0WL67_DAUCS|nr:hypothetical protein DCAR_0209403 [Daucus carota subsp. sativus]
MHQKKSGIHICKEPLTIKIPQEIVYTNEHNFKNPSSKIKKPLFTTPHQRPSFLMSQTPSNLSHSQNPHLPNTIISPKSTSLLSSCCSFSFLEPLLATKTKALRISFLLFLPSLYFFSSNQIISIIVFSVVLVITLNLSAPKFPSIRLFLARSLPIKFSTLPSRTPPKVNSPVIWSIGSKPKLEKRPNTGSWVQVHKNGDVYEGEFYRGKCSGSGVYYYYMSGRYEGDWIDEKYDGHGVETWAKGSRYRGQYRQGLRHGFGVYRFYTGDVYAGEWCNGQSHGCGAHTCEDGSRYVGEFKWGVKHGLGSYHFRNGDVYAGEYFADKMHGFGVYSFAHGHRYEGAWHEGRRQGLGLYTFRNGETQSGHWENGVLNVSSTPGSPPGSPFAVSASRVLNAVKEARLAAERAATASKVEDKVNKAVAAANRAATAARVAAVRAVQNQIHQQNSDENIPLRIIQEDGDSRRQKYAV